MARLNKTSAIDSDKQWREEDDARTLAEAASIKKDKARLMGAKAGAQRMVEKESDRLSGLKSVARASIPKTTKKRRA